MLKIIYATTMLLSLIGMWLGAVLVNDYNNPDIGMGLHPLAGAGLIVVMAVFGWVAAGNLARAEIEG